MPRALLTTPWTREEMEELRELLFKGKSLASIAVHFRRSQSTVSNKLRALSLPTPFQLKRQVQEERRRSMVH